jgi:hypothetical protein
MAELCPSLSHRASRACTAIRDHSPIPVTPPAPLASVFHWPVALPLPTGQGHASLALHGDAPVRLWMYLGVPGNVFQCFLLCTFHYLRLSPSGLVPI